MATPTLTTSTSAGDEEPRRSETRRRFGRYLLTKLVEAVTSLVVVLILGFFLFRIIPGDPVQTMTRGREITDKQLAALRHSLGLDEPLWMQFLHYVGNTVTGDLGTSWEFRRPVIDLIAERLGPTLLLTGTATVIAAALGFYIGIRSGWRRGSGFDRTHTGVALTLWSAPPFWMGLILLIVVGVGVGPIPGIFPTGGMQSANTAPGVLPHVLDVAHHLVLPCLSLIAAIYAQYLLVMRSSLLDEVGEDYLTTARAKGLRDDHVRSRHAVPNALLPTVTLVFLHLGLVLTGTITIETVYSWPGLGYLTYQALTVPDLPVLQGTFFVFSAGVIIMNAFADVLYRALDPRVRAS